MDAPKAEKQNVHFFYIKISVAGLQMKCPQKTLRPF